MTLIKKLFVLPIGLMIKLICILGNLLTNLSSYVLALFLLVIGVCGIICVVSGRWTELGILVVMGLSAFMIMIAIVFFQMKVESINDRFRQFLHS